MSAPGRTAKSVAWTYERPRPEMKAVTDRVGFWEDVKVGWFPAAFPQFFPSLVLPARAIALIVRRRHGRPAVTIGDRAAQSVASAA